MVRGNVLIDSLVTREPSASRNLFRAVVFLQQGFDHRPAPGCDPGNAARVTPASPRMLVRALAVVAALVRVAPQLPRDRASMPVELAGNRRLRQSRAPQGVNLVSFGLGQVATGHGQLHLAVKWLRLRHLALFSDCGVATQS